MSWYKEEGNQKNFVISTRARLARNIKGMRFTSSMTAQDSANVIKTVLEAIAPIADNFEIFNIWEMTEQERGALVEKRLISPAFKAGALKRTALISKDESICIMLNEEDHIRIQCFAPGLDPKKALDTCGKIDALLRETIDFSYHDKYGYLTSCPTNCGTALRLSAMVHLPALAISGGEQQLIRESARHGMTVRGVYGEGSGAPGNFYQISNQITLGITTGEILETFSAMIDVCIKAENTLRGKIAKSPTPKLLDQIYRAYGILQNAYLLESNEFIALQSLVRLGIYLGIIEADAKILTQLWIETAPCNLGNASESERDIKRAEIVKNKLRR